MACCLATGLVGAPLGADEARPELREAVAEGRIVPLTTILDWLDERYRGQVIEVELEVHDDELVYEIDLLGPSGQRVEFLFDAASGELRSIRGVNIREMRRDQAR
ncbi:PepSY domain-containing protein [Methylonatrum kenyense]|uniref:PepSY domain-containing protein n=1 Tax=Methylonatrum kenyense TaxID=455253 RepID=UPI0020BD5E37|nr:PepSY domain-containing protein [Methylonatrum kenyense]MCK8517140.1 PepSY domain-containing protein [Methylonatrum kenyense]